MEMHETLSYKLKAHRIFQSFQLYSGSVFVFVSVSGFGVSIRPQGPTGLEGQEWRKAGGRSRYIVPRSHSSYSAKTNCGSSGSVYGIL